MPQKLTPSVMGGEPGVVKRNPLNALHLVPEMLQRVGGQRQNLGPHVARRAGAGKEIWGGELASTTGGPGSDSSTPRKKWGHVPQLSVPFDPKARRGQVAPFWVHCCS